MRFFFSSVVLVAFSLFIPHALSVLNPDSRQFNGGHMNLGSTNLDRIPKYFTEPGVGEIYGHYDSRYWSGTASTPEEISESLYHMTRAYLESFRKLGIATWLAHGTLLGWFWNGRHLPWDSDVDMQVASSSLELLAAAYNQSVHSYDVMHAEGDIEVRNYVLDVNPYFVSRHRGNWKNMIDARFIDVRNGLFIDVTALYEVNPEKKPGVWGCKNYHWYDTLEIWPLRESVFEGMPALVPFAFEKVLADEYGEESLERTTYEG